MEGKQVAEQSIAARKIAIDPDPLDPYRISAGFVVGDLVFLSGQGAIDDSGNVIHVGDFRAQFERTLTNIDAVLARVGSSIERVVKATIYVTDMANHTDIVDLRQRWGRPYPADSVVEVSALAVPELLVEVDVVALAGDGAIIDE